MKATLYRMDDGTWTALVMRTRTDENPTRVVSNIKRGDLKAAVEQAAKEVSAPRVPLIHG